MNLREMWQRIVRSKYNALLEAEVARLRAENRALLNSILGIAGVPPITVGAADPAPELAASGRAGATGIAKEKKTPGDSSVEARKQNMTSVAAPTRRRSWHQVYRMLEIDAARKKEIA